MNKVVTNISLEPELKRAAEIAAKAAHQSLAAWIREAMRARLKAEADADAR